MHHFADRLDRPVRDGSSLSVGFRAESTRCFCFGEAKAFAAGQRQFLLLNALAAEQIEAQRAARHDEGMRLFDVSVH